MNEEILWNTDKRILMKTK